MCKILLVEDNENNSDMLIQRLTLRGYNSLLAENGAAALELAQAELPDLILMDIQIPAPNGLEVTRQLKSMPEMRAIPIIALTAQAMLSDQEAAQAAGCDDFATKPIDFEQLIFKIQRWLPPIQQSNQSMAGEGGIQR